MAELPAPSQQSLLALSWLNFFLSGMQTAFGPIFAAYLAAQGWAAKDIGFVLSIGGTASLVSQAPGGEFVDAVRAKRLLVAIGVVTVALSVLIFCFWSSFPLVALAEVLQGVTAGGRCDYPRTGRPRPVGRTAWTEPALRRRRRRRGYPNVGPVRI
jgi:MFS family permease